MYSMVLSSHIAGGFSSLIYSAVEVCSIALCRWKFVGEVFQGSTHLCLLPSHPLQLSGYFGPARGPRFRSEPKPAREQPTDTEVSRSKQVLTLPRASPVLPLTDLDNHDCTDLSTTL